MRLCPLVVALALVAAACGDPADPAPRPALEAAPQEAPRPAAGEGFRIAVLGDSLAAGFGLPESEAFPAQMERILRDGGHTVEVVNAGVSGDTTAGGLSRVDWVLRSDPDLLVVELGGNDALRGQPLSNMERNLRAIVRRARKAGARVLLLGMDIPTNYGPDYADGFADLYRRVADDEDVELLPGFVREVGLNRSLMMPDGLHPTAEGHRKLAEKLAAALTRSGRLDLKPGRR